MDAKLVLGFIADLLYFKGLLCYEEIDAILDMKDASDVERFIERLSRGEFNVYKRGEVYTDYGAGRE